MEDEVVSRDYDWYISPAGAVRRVWENVQNGTIPLSELDDQEVSHMRVKASDGRFGGPKPHVTKKLASEFRRELLRRYEDRIQASVMQAHEAIVGVMESPSATGSEKFRAAQYLIERAVGKVPDKMEITAEVKPWEGTVAGILTDVADEEETDEMKEIEA